MAAQHGPEPSRAAEFRYYSGTKSRKRNPAKLAPETDSTGTGASPTTAMTRGQVSVKTAGTPQDEASIKASAGELGGPAFDIPISTAQAIVTDARNRGRVADNTDRLHRLVHAMLDIALAGAAKLEQKAERGTLTAQDATFGRRLTQLAGHAAQLNHALAQDPPPARPPSPKSAQDLREHMERDLAARNALDRAAASEPQPAPRSVRPG